MENSGFWQRTLDCALLLFILGVIGLKVADIVKVICVDWGQIFTVAGILAFIAVLICAVRNAFADDEDEMPTLRDHSASSPKTGKGGGK
jgi:hypothetical protein